MWKSYEIAGLIRKMTMSIHDYLILIDKDEYTEQLDWFDNIFMLKLEKWSRLLEK